MSMANVNTIHYRCEQQILWISLNRAEKRNALMLFCSMNYGKRFKWVRRTRYQTLCLKAEGEYFSAGADLMTMKKIANQSFDENLNNAKQLADVFTKLYRCPQANTDHGAR